MKSKMSLALLPLVLTSLSAFAADENHQFVVTGDGYFEHPVCQGSKYAVDNAIADAKKKAEKICSDYIIQSVDTQVTSGACMTWDGYHRAKATMTIWCPKGPRPQP